MVPWFPFALFMSMVESCGKNSLGNVDKYFRKKPKDDNSNKNKNKNIAAAEILNNKGRNYILK